VCCSAAAERGWQVRILGVEGKRTLGVPIRPAAAPNHGKGDARRQWKG
jgi:hypothetical protein